MAQINLSTRIKAFLVAMRAKNAKNFAPVAKALTAGSLIPGDIVYFRYVLRDKNGKWTRDERIALIVSCNRGPGGFFISTRNNMLLASFKLDNRDPEIVGFLLKSLYKNRRACNYYKIIDALSVILGKRDFRTYKVKSSYNVHEFTVDTGTLPTLETQDEE